MSKGKGKVETVNGEEALIEVGQTVLGTKKTKQKKIKIRPFVTTPMHVGVKYGSTIPTGDYANVKVEVFISMPCYVEEVGSAFKQVEELADKLTDRCVEKLTGGKHGSKKE